MGDDHIELKRLKKVLADEFEIKDLDFLSIEFARSKRASLFLNRNMCWILLER